MIRKKSYYGKSSNEHHMWLGVVNCSGNENRLSECARSAWGYENCSGRDEVAGVVCSVVGHVGNQTNCEYGPITALIYVTICNPF